MRSQIGLRPGISNWTVFCIFVVFMGLPFRCTWASVVGQTQDRGSIVQQRETRPGEQTFQYDGAASTSSQNSVARQGVVRQAKAPLKKPADASEASNKSKSKKLFESGAWPTAKAINKQLEILADFPPTQAWCVRTTQIFETLENNEGLHDHSSREAFEQLKHQLNELDQIVVDLHRRQPTTIPTAVTIQLNRIKYSILRRLEVWPVVHELASKHYQSLAQADQSKLATMIKASSIRINFGEVDPSWADYLMTEEATKVFNALTPNDKEEKKLARKILARLYSPVLTKQQREFIGQMFSEELVEYLKIQARDQVDFTKLLYCIERLESEPSGGLEYLINDQYQNLIWSNDPLALELGSTLQTHYRNANVRFAISSRLINRMVPDMPDSQEPVSENIMGARVFGNSQISNSLHVRLVPDPNHLHMSLETQGNVRTRTRAQKSGFTVLNEGNSKFEVIKNVAIGHEGFLSDQPVAVSSTNNRLLGIRGKYDPVPLVGWMARRIAQNQIRAQAPTTNKIARQKLESSVENRMEQEVESQLSQLQEFLDANLTQPLVALELEPDPVQMATTENELVTRYRLAGRDQMASFTARPRSLDGSLLSFQFHQSAINNVLARTELSGNKFTPMELVQHLQNVFGTSQSDASELEGIEAELEFDRFDPIRVDFRDGEVVIKLSFKRLKVGKTVWKKISVSCPYRLESDGLQFSLTKSAPILPEGSKLKFRDRAAILGIFGELFENQYQFSAFSDEAIAKIGAPALRIAQLIVDNGWVGVSINEVSPPVRMDKPRLFGRRIDRPYSR